MQPHRLPSFLMTIGFLLSPALAAAEPPSHSDPASVWDLGLLFRDDAAWHAAKNHVAAEIPKIKNYQGRLGESASTLREAMDFIYGLRKVFDRMAVYTSLNAMQTHGIPQPSNSIRRRTSSARSSPGRLAS